ncbi:MAG: hypothetical protein L0210_10130 [Rhodospirillales bacterium]|nr:hypothetical protein [Rhodospirillales bacterium]
MTLTQILLINIVVLTLGIALHMIKQAAKSRNHSMMTVETGFRNVGTFGSLRNFSGDTQPGGSVGLKSVFLVLLLGIGGTVFTAVWHEANPDIRTPYGRAFERCVAKEQISRWRVEEVRRCVNSMRAE